MKEIICSGCGKVVDYEGIEPLTSCECSECGSEINIPFYLDYLRLNKLLFSRCGFDCYDGFDMSNNLDSIIYILDNDNEDRDQLLKLAQQQISELTSLKHTNICPLINSGIINNIFFASEPKMDGYTLSIYTPETQGKLNIAKVVDVVQAASLGLAVAHHKELSHHDITPENIHIDERGNVRVKNFFISRIRSEVEHLKADKSSVSPFFISPEKAESLLEDKRGDIFSLGVLFYYMLTGEYPFSGRNDIETVYSRIYKKQQADEEVFCSTENRMVTPDTVEYIPPVPPQTIREDIPSSLGNTIMRMLEYHPFKRPTLPEVLDVMSLYQARQARENIFTKQMKMVMTKTRAVPKMTNLGDSPLQKKKRNFLKSLHKKS